MDVLPFVLASLEFALLIFEHYVRLAQGGNITILGDITVTGAVRTTSIRTQTLTIGVSSYYKSFDQRYSDGSLSTTHGISGESLQVNHAEINLIESVALSSETGTVHIAGQLVIGFVH